jgi:NitT/TauT family transport system substrate-binding protein
MTFRQFWASVAIATLLASPAAAAPFRLIVTDLETPLVPNSVMDLALQGGYFERAGVDVELVRVQQTPMAMVALQSGEGEMANVAVDALLQIIARGAADLRAVTSPNKSLPFLIAAQTGIATPADLAGKRFGVGRIGSLDHSLSMKVLADSGVDTDKLEILTLGQPNVRAQALLAGQVDATTMSIGTYTALPDRKGINILVDVDAYYKAAPVVSKVNAVSTKTLQTRGPEVQAVIEALTLASRDFASNPASWVEAMVKARPDVARTDLETLGTAFAGSWSTNGGLEKSELEYTADWIYQGEDFKALPKVPLDQWVDFAPLDAVLAKIGQDTSMDAVSR